MLHLYIRHRRDTQSYGNQWFGDFRLLSLTTYEVVAEYCKNAQEQGQRISTPEEVRKDARYCML